MRSDAVIPGAMPGELILIRTDRVAVAVGSVRAYPNGFEFALRTRRREEDEDWPGGDPTERHRRGGQDMLRLGIAYADGRRTATRTGGLWHHDEAGTGLVLMQNGGGGSSRSWDGDFWVSPLPPDGPVTLVASWLAYGVAETRAELDGTAIREAAGRAVILWPEDPEFEPISAAQRTKVVRTASAECGDAAGPPGAPAPGGG
jgi:hypothetical protein